MDTKDEIELSQAINRTEHRFEKKIELAITYIEDGAIRTGLNILKECINK